MTFRKIAVASAFAALMAIPAFAQPPQRSPEELEAAFTKGDADKDGKLTAAEFKETLPEQFKSQVTDDMLPQILARRDADKDGFISKAEFSAPRPQ
jgi:Ca2+-binding EF-hand superfamily protein